MLKITHVIDISKIVNIIRARALNHWQFVTLLEEHESKHSDISYPPAVRWLSLGKVLKRVWVLKAETKDHNCKARAFLFIKIKFVHS